MSCFTHKGPGPLEERLQGFAIDLGQPNQDDRIVSIVIVSRAKPGGNSVPVQNVPAPRTGAPFRRRWLKPIGIFLASLVVVTIAAYAMRCTLLLNVARMALDRQTELVEQEHADGVAIAFAKPPSAWVRPMKNRMNGIWAPIRTTGVNYYLFAGPRTWLNTYSERSNPASPYYQAWVGAYVIKQMDGTLSDDLQSLAWQTTALDQRAWLSTMGDPSPLAESSPVTSAGTIMIDGHTLPLWHGTMQSHSDISADPKGPLATLIGMPPKSSWPAGVDSFHDVTLNGYFTWWADSARKVSIVVYAVAASYAGQMETVDSRSLVNDELLRLMKSAKLEIVH